MEIVEESLEILQEMRTHLDVCQACCDAGLCSTGSEIWDRSLTAQSRQKKAELEGYK